MARDQKQVLILSTIANFTLGLIRTAVLAGWRPHIASDRAWTNDRMSVHAQRRLLLPLGALTEGSPEALDLINEYVARHRIDLVLAADTRCTRMLIARAGAIRGAAVFPMPTLEVFEQLYDKWTFYQLLVQHDLPSPRTVLVRSPEEAERLDLGWPVIVKPPSGESGKGVRKVDEPGALRRDLEASAAEGTLPLLVQEFLPGRDIDLDLLAEGGELTAWLVQQREGAGMRFPDDERLVSLGRAMCRASGYRGVGHVDMRIDDRTGEVKVIEFNPRFWGSLGFASWFGVNFFEHGVALLGAERPAFVPQVGTCPWLGAAPGNLVRWARGGFAALGSSEAQRRAWRVQLRDPLPEWRESFLTLIGRPST
jgi:biotin carboxylase